MASRQVSQQPWARNTSMVPLMEVEKIPGLGTEAGEPHSGRLLSSYHSATKSVGRWLSSRQKYKYALISLGPSGSCMIGG